MAGLFRGITITTRGEHLLAKVDAGQTLLKFTVMRTSSMVYGSGTDFKALTSLANIEQEETVGVPLIVNDTQVMLRTIFTNTGLATSYNINIYGIYANDPDLGEILFAVNPATDTPPLMPSEAEGPSSFIPEPYLTVRTTSVVDMTVNEAATATYHDILRLEELINQMRERKYSKFVIGTTLSGHTASEVDFLCTGTNDHIVCQDAVNFLNAANGGHILFLEGKYSFGNAVAINATKKNVKISGESYGSVQITGPASGAAFALNGAANIEFDSLNIVGGSSSAYGLQCNSAASAILVKRCKFNDCRNYLDGDIVFEDCSFTIEMAGYAEFFIVPGGNSASVNFLSCAFYNRESALTCIFNTSTPANACFCDCLIDAKGYVNTITPVFSALSVSAASVSIKNCKIRGLARPFIAFSAGSTEGLFDFIGNEIYCTAAVTASVIYATGVKYNVRDNVVYDLMQPFFQATNNNDNSQCCDNTLALAASGITSGFTVIGITQGGSATVRGNKIQGPDNGQGIASLIGIDIASGIAGANVSGNTIRRVLMGIRMSAAAKCALTANIISDCRDCITQLNNSPLTNCLFDGNHLSEYTSVGVRLSLVSSGTSSAHNIFSNSIIVSAVSGAGAAISDTSGTAYRIANSNFINIKTEGKAISVPTDTNTIAYTG